MNADGDRGMLPKNPDKSGSRPPVKRLSLAGRLVALVLLSAGGSSLALMGAFYWPQIARFFGITCAVVPVAAGAIYIARGIWIDVREGRQANREFAARQPMSDEAFLAEIGAMPPQAKVCLAARYAFAKAAGLEPGKLRPTDLADWLGNRMWLLLDNIQIVIELENKLGIGISDDLGEELFGGPFHLYHLLTGCPRARSLTVGRFALDLARAIEADRCPAKSS